MPKSPAQDATILLDQSRALQGWLAAAPVEVFATATVLPGWDVRALVGHLLVMHEGLLAVLDRPSRDQPMEMWALVGRYTAAADEIGRAAGERAGADDPDALLARLAATTESLAAGFARTSLPAVVLTPRGPGRLGEFLRTRILDLVVHTDDLAHSLEDPASVPMERKALATACRTLATILADRHPGRSVEVRVPPYAAVQCGVGEDGPTHTRGTPPNVIETDPISWLRLATGRMSWAELRAQGKISASGHRADLSSALPLLS